MKTNHELPADLDNLIAGLRIENINLKLAAKQAEALLREAEQNIWHPNAVKGADTLAQRINEFLASQQGEQGTAAENAGVHPEQADGAQGEREAFESRFPIPEGIEWRNTDYFPVPTENVGIYVGLVGVAARYSAKWEAWQTRAALAQPSPHCSTCNDTALIGDLPLECPDCCGMELQPSPVPELERPEVVGYCDPNHIQRMRDDQITGFMVHEEKGVYTCEPLMTVAQHERILRKAQFAPVAQAGRVPEVLLEAIKWADHLLFECGALVQTRAPSIHVYNQTYAAVEAAKALIAAAPAQGGGA